MKIAFIIQFNNPSFGGMFFTSTTRIKYFINQNKDFEVSIFNVRAKPIGIIRSIRYLVKREKFYPATSIFNDLQVENIYYSISFLEILISKIFKHHETKYQKKVPQLARHFHEVDLIAAHFGNGPGELALYLSEYLNKKFTVTFHGSDIHTTPFLNEKNFYLFRQMLKRSYANIFLSQYLMKRSLEIYDASRKNFILYNGIDFDHFKPYEDEIINRFKEKLMLNNKVIGFVGNLIDVKNVFSLVGIFRKIHKKIKDVSFIIIGDGYLKKKLHKNFGEKDIKVKFLGNIDIKEMPLYFNLMDVLVLPSKKEGLPRVLIEAMACGVNCVGSKAGGIPELLEEENTFALDKDFEVLIANRIVELLTSNHNPYIDRTQLDLRNIAVKQGEIYRKIIGNKL